jgi:ribosomal protein S27AE
MGGERVVSRGETAGAFGGETLVVCPRCGRRAVMREMAEHPAGSDHRYRLVCPHCGCTASFSHLGFFRRAGSPDGLRLWLETPCCGETLLARNAAHLDYLERYVRAELRERVADPRWGWANRSIVSRLPRWVGSAKNRAEVLRCIQRLRDRLGTG